MQGTTPELERQLESQLRTQMEHYKKALEIADTLAHGFATRGNTSAGLAQLAAILDQVAEVNVHTLHTRARWEASGRSASAGLRNAVSGLQAQLQKLIAEISEAETQAQSACDRLKPELGTEARRRRMLQAYAGTRIDAEPVEGACDES